MIPYRTLTPALHGTATMPLDDDWLTLTEAAEVLGISRSTIFRLRAAGQLAGVREYRPPSTGPKGGPSKKVYLHRDDLIRWRDRHAQELP